MKQFNGEIESSIKTNIRSVDNIMGGLTESAVTIIAARPAMGKSAVAVQVAYNVSFVNKVPSAFFSLEMPTSQLINRFLANHTRNSNKEIRDMFGGSKEMLNSYIEKSKSFSPDNLYIFDGYFELDHIISKAKELIRSKGVRLIVIDYVQLIEVLIKGNREQSF